MNPKGLAGHFRSTPGGFGTAAPGAADAGRCNRHILPERNGESIIQLVTLRARRATFATLVLGLVGLALFILTLERVGVSSIGRQLANVGWGGFAIILALSGLRHAARSAAWVRCIEGDSRLSFLEAFDAMLVGEALGKVTSFSSVVSEPAKAVAAGRRVPLPAAFSAIVVENIAYGLSLALLIVVGAVAFLLAYDMPPVLRWLSLSAIAVMLTIVTLTLAALGMQATPLSRLLGRLESRGAVPRWIAGRAAGIRGLEQRISSFAHRHPARLLPIAACELLFHAAGIAETYVTLRLVGTDAAPTVLTALILESAGRFINVVFTFVPLRLGVDEAGSGLMGAILRLGPSAGVTLALVRRARVLAWTGVGVVLLLRRGLSIRSALAGATAAGSSADLQRSDT